MCAQTLKVVSTKRGSGLLFFIAKMSHFQLNYVKNKLYFNEMTIMFALYNTNTLSSFAIVLAHWNNSPRLEMSLHSNTLSWFQSSLNLNKERTHDTRDEKSNHCTIDLMLEKRLLITIPASNIIRYH